MLEKYYRLLKQSDKKYFLVVQIVKIFKEMYFSYGLIVQGIRLYVALGLT